jgi:hypothetical protein
MAAGRRLQGVRRTVLPSGEELTDPSTLTSALALTGFCVIVYPLSLWIYGWAVDVGRKYGTLAGY